MTPFLPRRHMLIMIGILALLLPLLAACGGEPEAAEENGSVPTAEIVAPSETDPPPLAEEGEALPTDVPQLEPTVVDSEASPDEPVAQEFPLQTPYLNFGVVTHLYYTDHERVLQLTQNAGFDWIRQQIHWKDIEIPDQPPEAWGWNELDTLVEATNRYGIKLLINIVQSPSVYNETNGLPDEPQALGNFVEEMAKRYGDKIQAYEIWNEPNLAIENGGRIEPADVGHYVEILMESYTRIKAISPDAYVLAAASSSTGVTDPAVALSDEDFYRAMYTYRDGIIDGFFDVQAVHPGGAANPPDTLWPESPSFIEGCTPAPDQCWNDHSTHYFRHVENVRQWMEEYGFGNHQIWITEFGWATQNNSPGYEFGNFVSMEQQAEYITSAIQRAHDQYPWIGNMFLWNMNFAVTKVENGLDPLHEQASFAILNGDWSPRPSYLALQELIARLKQEQGRS